MDDVLRTVNAMVWFRYKEERMVGALFAQAVSQASQLEGLFRLSKRFVISSP